jgi:hypothetical protein
MHIPCPDCSTGWIMPEDGHSHLRPCPTCHGHAYISDLRGDEADSIEQRRNTDEGSIIFSPQTLSSDPA